MIGKILGMLLIPGALLESLLRGPPEMERVRLWIKGEEFDLLVADTPRKWTAGLRGRDIGEREGALFVFPDERRRTFWMWGTRAELDILFLDGEGRVVKVFEKARPCSFLCRFYSSRGRYVLELKGGTARELGIQEGEKILEPLS